VKNKIYIAGGWDERVTVVRPYIDKALRAGFTITLDWTLEEGIKDADRGDSLLVSEVRLRAAQMDSRAINRADIFWLLAPSYKGSSGSWWELGYAMALAANSGVEGKLGGHRKDIIVSGPNWKRSIFTELIQNRFDTHEEAFTFLTTERAPVRDYAQKPCNGCLENDRATRSLQAPMPGIPHTCGRFL